MKKTFPRIRQAVFFVLPCLILPVMAQANMGRGAEGFFIMLLSSWILAPLLFAELVLVFMRFFYTALRRNIFLGLNLLALCASGYGVIRFLVEQPPVDMIWVIIPALILAHLIAILMPIVQFKIMTRTTNQ